MNRFNFIWVLALPSLLACSTGKLSETGAKVKLLTHEPTPLCTEISKTDDVIASSSSSDRKKFENSTRNKASKEDATHVGIKIEDLNGEGDEGDVKIVGTSYSCSGMVDLSYKNLQRYCTSNNALACAQLGYLDERKNDLVKALSYFELACKLGAEQTCAEIEELKERIAINNLKTSCNDINNKDPHACLQLSLIYYKKNDLLEAVNFAQIACVKGSSEACGFHRDFISEQNARRQESLTKRVEAQRHLDHVIALRQQQMAEEQRHQDQLDGTRQQQQIADQQNQQAQSLSRNPSSTNNTRTCRTENDGFGHLKTVCQDGF